METKTSGKRSRGTIWMEERKRSGSVKTNDRSKETERLRGHWHKGRKNLILNSIIQGSFIAN